jgi:hypothetical protein
MNSSFCHWDFGFKSQNMGHVAEKNYVAEKKPGEMFNMFQPKMFHIVP